MDTLKLVYTQDEAFELVDEYTEAYKNKIKQLEEENKKLKKECEENEYLVHDNAKWMKRCEEKIMEIKKLKSDLDKYKKYYDRDKEELMESCYSLAKENEKLKKDLSECECSMHFENDEVGFWEREYKRLKKWIKDHCKGYGNLFPEDEMKRQRKKADKKRK